MELKERAYGHELRSYPSSQTIWREVAGLSDYLIVVALTGILLCIALLLGRFTTFFTVDHDIKYLAASSLLHHWNNAAIPYPLKSLDPSGRYTLPLTAWVHGHQYAGYSLPFELLAAAAMSLFGPAGLVLPPILGTSALLTIQLQLASALGLKGRREVLLLATVAATPVFFYSLVFWEHTWGVAFLLGGLTFLIVGATRDQPSAWLGSVAGGLFAGAVLMRRETLIPAALALVIVPLTFRRRAALMQAAIAAAAFLIPLGIIFVLQPQPLVLGLTHASPGRAGIAPGASSSKLHRLEWLTTGSYATALFVLCSLALLVTRWLRSNWLPAVLSICSVVAGIGFAVELVSHYTWADLNPLAFCPLAIWGLWGVLMPARDGSRTAVMAVWGICVGGAVATVVMASDSGGAQWGPRYLLFAFPLLTLLAFKAREEVSSRATGRYEKRAVEFSFVGVLALSILLQGPGVMEIAIGKQELSTAQATIERLQPRVVVSRDLSIDGLAPLAGSKTLLFAPSHSDFTTLMALLRSHGRRSVILICAASTRCQWTSPRGWSHGSINAQNSRIFRYAVYHARG
jgi:hypothetical protein